MPAKRLATYAILGKSWQILAATFRKVLTVSALYASPASRWPKGDHLGIRRAATS
jgi:hypothetical protein